MPITSLHFERRRPRAAVHLNRGLGPFAAEDAAVGGSFPTQLCRLAKVPVELLRDLVLAGAAEPTMTEKGLGATHEEEVGNVPCRLKEGNGKMSRWRTEPMSPLASPKQGSRSRTETFISKM